MSFKIKLVWKINKIMIKIINNKILKIQMKIIIIFLYNKKILMSKKLIKIYRIQ
jgi:hypothetical protein